MTRPIWPTVIADSGSYAVQEDPVTKLRHLARPVGNWWERFGPGQGAADLESDADAY
jgi:hypothetical protein